MRVYISGQSKKHDPKHVREAARFFINKLLSNKKTNVSVTVKFVPNLEKRTSASGFCGWRDKPYRPRRFMIELDSRLNTNKMIEILAHECVHVKQYVLGEMRDLKNGDVRWKGADFVHDPDIIGDDDYYLLPWEIDAFGRTPGLMFSYYNRPPKKK